MSLPSDTVLYRYLAGALEPGQRREVEAALLRSPALMSRLAAFRAELEEAPAEAERWFIPPPGVAGGRSGFVALHVGGAVMGDDDLRPGDRFRVRFRVPDDVDERQVVVLREVGRRWQVVFPEVPEDVLPAGELQDSRDGRRFLDLAAAAEPGVQRWAIALPHRDLAVRWDQDGYARWSDIVAAMAAGEVPVSSLEIRVGLAA